MPKLEPPTRHQLDAYHGAVNDWITNTYRNEELGLVPRPFPVAPYMQDYQEDGTNPVDSGVLGIPITEVKIQFARVDIDGENRLVIVVPKRSL